ncbi:MAG: TlpA disulfide reductase family protein [Christensenellaceae bacterium]|nr:TlpA disulfide reductase family protein [Christensenellaceae bacterium]
MKKILTVLLALLCLTTSTAFAEDTNTQEIPDFQYSLDTMQWIPEFNCVDSDGNPVTNEIFAQNKVTLINLWGTWCGPCVAEIPDLQAVYELLKDEGVGIIGVVEDASGNEELVNEILNSNGVTYANIYPDEMFFDNFVSLCYAFPSSIIVDSEGNVIMPLIMGARGVEGFEKDLRSALAIADNDAPKQGSAPESVSAASQDNIEFIEESYASLANQIEEKLGSNSVQYKNVAILKDLNYKSYAYCSDGYTAEVLITKDGEVFTTTKVYAQNGSVRRESHGADGLSYLTMYNRDADTAYEYDAQKGTLDTVTVASKKGRAMESYRYGYMDFVDYNVLPATFTQTELDGRNVWLAEFIIEGRIEDRTWIDAATGVTIKNEYVAYDEEGKPGAKYETSVNVTPNLKFSPELFDYDEGKMTGDEILADNAEGGK